MILAAQAIKCRDAKVIIAGGMESMSNAPYLLYARQGFRYGDQKLVDSMIHYGLWCAFEKQHMGHAAEYTAEKSRISREEQDRFAYQSHMKAVRAMESGNFSKELISLAAKDGMIEKDETPRPDTSIEKLSKLRPAFKENGTVTAGNAPGLNDGASALLWSSSMPPSYRHGSS